MTRNMAQNTGKLCSGQAGQINPNDIGGSVATSMIMGNMGKRRRRHILFS